MEQQGITPKDSQVVITLPDFVIVGAARAGTTALAAALQRHPQVCFSKVKETNYFTPPEFGLNGLGDRHNILTEFPLLSNGTLGQIQAGAGLVRSRQLYEQMFAHRTPGQRCGEASPSYLYYHDHAAPALYAANPHCKIVVILRERVQRALSQYKVMVTWGREFMQLKAALGNEDVRLAAGCEHFWQYTSLSLYGPGLASFLAVFPREQILLLDFDAYVRQPEDALRKVARFLDIAPDEFYLTKDNDSLARLSRPRLHFNRLSQRYGGGLRERLLARVGGVLNQLEKRQLIPAMRLDERSFPDSVLAQFHADEAMVAELLARYQLEIA